MLIRRTEQGSSRRAARPHCRADPMTVSTAAASCAAPVWSPAALRRSAPCRSRSVRKAQAGPPPPAGAQVATRKNICTHCSVGCTVTAEVANGVWIGQEPSWDSPINRGSHCAKGASVRELVHGDRRLKYPMKLVNGQWTPHQLGSGDRRDRRQAGGDPPEIGAGLGLLARLGQILQRRHLSVPQAGRVLGHQQPSIIRPASAIRPPSPASPIPGATAR